MATEPGHDDPLPFRPMPQEILDFYSRETDEAERLTEGRGKLERIRLREVLERFLPPVPAVICDVGGAAGVHSFWLAELGYAVHLVDVTPRHIDQARERASRPGAPRLASIMLGDARRLDLPDEFADAVLMHGPLYHLTERADRLAALSEARRVLRPGGLLFAAGVSCYASTIVGLQQGWVWDAAYEEMITQEMTTGQHRRPANWRTFTTAFFHHPDQLQEELEAAGMLHEGTFGLQGPGWLAPDFDACMEDEGRREVILRIARQMEKDPVLSPHHLAVARKTGARKAVARQAGAHKAG